MRLTTRLYEVRKASTDAGAAEFTRDPETGVLIQFARSLPDQVYRRLYEIQTFSAPLSGILAWDNDSCDRRCFYKPVPGLHVT